MLQSKVHRAKQCLEVVYQNKGYNITGWALGFDNLFHLHYSFYVIFKSFLDVDLPWFFYIKKLWLLLHKNFWEYVETKS